MIDVTDSWKAAYPDSHAGFLVMRGVSNPAHDPELESLKRSLESELQTRLSHHDRRALETFSILPAYSAYYRQFKKTYHVQAQVESVVFKGKSLPRVTALVDAMFIAELKNLVLTAGHDLDRLQAPITVNVATGNESYTTLRGQEQVLKAGDMFMADQGGVISSIVYGPDQRTQITAETRNVLYAAYAPTGIGASVVLAHLQDIRNYVLVVSPDASVQMLEVFGDPA